MHLGLTYQVPSLSNYTAERLNWLPKTCMLVVYWKHHKVNVLLTTLLSRTSLLQKEKEQTLPVCIIWNWTLKFKNEKMIEHWKRLASCLLVSSQVPGVFLNLRKSFLNLCKYQEYFNPFQCKYSKFVWVANLGVLENSKLNILKATTKISQYQSQQVIRIQQQQLQYPDSIAG